MPLKLFENRIHRRYITNNVFGVSAANTDSARLWRLPRTFAVGPWVELY
ncbi:hypothetical protein [Mesorhizobium sp. B2-4-15]|nr:hypothetical protein [Mesorhizobium sp. B2-4-15]